MSKSFADEFLNTMYDSVRSFFRKQPVPHMQETNPLARFVEIVDSDKKYQGIYDRKTSILWYEGPDSGTDADYAKKYMKFLGQDWTFPTSGDVNNMQTWEAGGGVAGAFDCAFTMGSNAYSIWTQSDGESRLYPLSIADSDKFEKFHYGSPDRVIGYYRVMAIKRNAVVPLPDETTLKNPVKLPAQVKFQLLGREDVSLPATLEWIEALGNSWKMPTADELHQMTSPLPRLPYGLIWCGRRTPNTGWAYSIHDHWCYARSALSNHVTGMAIENF